MDAIQSAIAKKEILDSLRPIDPEREQIIMQKFRLDWNYHSNHIEGNSLSYGETKALLLFNITAQGKPLKDHFEIKGHNEAIDWVLEIIKTKGDLTEHFIRQLHEVLLKEPYMSDAMTADGKPTKKKIEVGKYKTLPNHVKTVTGEIFRFASPEETPAKMHDLLTWYNEKKEQQATNPILLAAEFHYRFVRIHPFDDGNGRMARMLMNFILMQYGYPPVIIRSEDKPNYISVLEQADTTSITPFIEYIAGNLDSSLDIMIAGAKGESIEEPDDIDKELELLERKVFNTAKRVTVFKNDTALVEIFDYEITPLILIAEDSFRKMNRFYKDYTYSISGMKNHLRQTLPFKIVIDRLSTNPITYQQIMTPQKNYTSLSSLIQYGEPEQIEISYYYNEFYRDKEINYKSGIIILFDNIRYKVCIGNGETVEKLYNEKLRSSEVNSLLKAELKTHKSFIEKLIDGK